MIMKKNILVVDDSALMRRVICDIINSDDTFQVTDVCRDGLEAYEKLKVNRYDGVILDVNMPRMGGLELLERLQKERIKTNVIMVSTMTTRDADVTILAMERGAVDFVTKPTNIIEACLNDICWFCHKINCSTLHRKDRHIRIPCCHGTDHDHICLNAFFLQAL